jgi:periplasmic divalent cation tolerance protein
MTDETPYVVITTTWDDAGAASGLARALCEAQLAACVQSLPVQSTYWWQGAIESAGETMLLIKTKHALVDKVKDFITAHHTYEVPEIVVQPIIDGSQDYLDWIARETGEGS